MLYYDTVCYYINCTELFLKFCKHIAVKARLRLSYCDMELVVVVVVAMNIIKLALLQYMLQDHRTTVTIKTV